MFVRLPPTPINRLQGRLLNLATCFLGLYTLAITLAPAIRLRTWQTPLQWEVWMGMLAWLIIINVAHQQSDRWLPERDPYLLPVAALLTGMGLLTVWRLNPVIGARQTAWMIVAVGLWVIGLRLPTHLHFLRRYKYLWLTSGLLLTALTFIFGMNPLGYGPRLWLGCCGFYLQPSEPLKLLLIAYLAAYLADQQANLLLFSSTETKKTRFLSSQWIPILAPALIMTGMAIALLIFQRDLGTAAIFLFLFASLVYLSSGRPIILIFAGMALLAAGFLGWELFDVVRIRIDAWLNPWLDPSGRSYQIVQALIAIANGGLLGSGPGLGNPNLVPVAHSDFIFAAITEETGLIGALSLLVLLGLLANRGIRIAYRANNPYQRLLAAGLTAYLVGQSLLIIGGNLRLFPLTGVTLPFISSGGSSLVTAYLSLLALVLISNQPATDPAPRLQTTAYKQLAGALFALLAVAGLVTGWWTVVRSENLLNRIDNQRRSLADLYVSRGAILDRNYQVITQSSSIHGQYARQTRYPMLSSLVGYTHPIYGQTGLEASLDAYLRGFKGNPGYLVIWEQLLYRQPPPGRDIQITLDLRLQQIADQLLGVHKGAIVVLNAQSGEILSLASHPTYNANLLNENWNKLITDPSSPLINRSVQGFYPVGSSLGPVLFARLISQGETPRLPTKLDLTIEGVEISCTQPARSTWSEALTYGCPNAVLSLANSLGTDTLNLQLQSLGFYRAPEIGVPVAVPVKPQPLADPATILFQDLRASPLQVALAIAPLSADGEIPTAQLVTAAHVFEKGWIKFPTRGRSPAVFSSTAVALTQTTLLAEQAAVWQSSAVLPNGKDQTITWYLAGTVSSQPSLPVVVVVLLEENNPDLASGIGMTIIKGALEIGK